MESSKEIVQGFGRIQQKGGTCAQRLFDSRSSKYIKHFIHGFSGYLQTDEYCGYETVLKEHLLNYMECPELYLDNSVALYEHYFYPHKFCKSA